MKKLILLALCMAGTLFLSACETDKMEITLKNTKTESILRIDFSRGEEGGSIPQWVDLIHEGFPEMRHWILWGVIPDEYRIKLQFTFKEGFYFVMNDGSFVSVTEDYLEEHAGGVFYPTLEYANEKGSISIPLKKIKDPKQIKGLIFLTLPGGLKKDDSYYMVSLNFKVFYFPVNAKLITRDQWQLFLDPQGRRLEHFSQLFSERRDKKNLYEVFFPPS